MADVKQILDAVDTALGYVKALADTPGVNALPYVSTISSVIGVEIETQAEQSAEKEDAA